MKLVFYSPQTLPSIGGLQYVVHYWAEALSGHGHKITVITDTPSYGATPTTEVGAAPSPLRGRVGEGVGSSPPLSGGPGGPLFLRNASFLQQIRAMRSADKVVMFNVSIKGLPLWLLSGRSLYVTHHTALWYENGPRPFRQRLKQWIANNLVKGNCACSSYIAALYKKCRVIYSPYRSDVFVNAHKERIPNSILFAGRLVSDKGVDLLLNACALLKKEGLDFHLTIVGDGPDREKLEKLAKGIGFMGAPSATNAISPSADVAVDPELIPIDVVSPPPGLPACKAGGAGGELSPLLVFLTNSPQPVLMLLELKQRPLRPTLLQILNLSLLGSSLPPAGGAGGGL